MEKIQDRFFAELKEKFEKLGVKAILFDLDDTLIFTGEMFNKYKEEFLVQVSTETGIEMEVLKESLDRIDLEEYKRMGVNPERWEMTISRMSEEMPEARESLISNLAILGKIYTDEPRLRSGAKAILQILRELGMKMALVTHANEAWTWRKLEATGLAEFFDVIKIVNENGHKGVEDWAGAIDDLAVLPSECLGLGDSLSGDIIPAASIGVRTMWLHNGSTWSAYRVGEVPESTIHLDEVNQLLSALDRLG
jgi:FMN phosphatase YigB (HAD superfamily)